MYPYLPPYWMKIIYVIGLLNKICLRLTQVLSYMYASQSYNLQWTFLCFQKHIAIGRMVDVLSEFNGSNYPRDILDAYLHFESRTEHSYDFMCVQCGYYPTVVIMDANRKVACPLNCEWLTCSTLYQ